jgi:hypothetical protein
MIVEAEYPALRHVFFNMRERDRKEVFALFPHDDPELLAYMAWKRSSHLWTADGTAAFGVMPLWPGVASVWMLATDEFTAPTAREMVRHCRRFAKVHPEIHRWECRSLVEHTVAHRFIEACGLRREGELRSYGKGREDFVVFSRVAC